MKESVKNSVIKAVPAIRPANERYELLGTVPESAFNDLALLASEIFNLPICIISVIGEHEVYYKANVGFDGRKSEPLKNSLCGLEIKAGEVWVSEHLEGHADFFYNLHDIRFFAAAPLISPEGHQVGNFVIMGNKPMGFGAKKQGMLQKLADTAINLMEARVVQSEGKSLREEISTLIAEHKKISNENVLLNAYQQQIAQANNVLEGVLDSYELLFKYAPIAIGICSSDNRVIWQANDALTSIFGDGAQVIGADLQTLIRQVNGKDSAVTLDLVTYDVNSFHQKDAKLQIKYEDGYKNIYVDFSLQLVGRMGDEPQNIMFILADVTEQVILQQITREANSVLMSAIEDTGMGYTIVEFETGLMQSNDQLKSNYGYSSNEAFSYSDIFNAMLPKYRQVIKKAVNDAILSKGIYQAEYEVKWRDGSVHHIRAYGKPMYDADGKATHIIGLNKIIPDKS